MGPFSISDSSCATMFRNSSNICHPNVCVRCARMDMVQRATAPMDPARLDAIEKGLIDPDESLPFRIVEVNGVGGHCGIVPLAHEIHLRVFESRSYLGFRSNAQEQRTSVVRQTLDQMTA